MKSYLLALVLLFSMLSFSQENKIDINQLIKETQLSSDNPDVMSLIWWIPVEFWVAVLENDSSITKEQVDEIIEVLESYSMFAIVDGKIGPFGGVRYTPLEHIEKNISVISNNNIKYTPIDFDELNYDTQNLLLAFKPMIENMLGAMGENLHFFVFPDVDENNNRIFDPKSEGKVTMQFNESEYAWKTPLGAVMPLKVCPFDKEKINGTWNYCPWHGDKLQTLTKQNY